MGKAAQTSKKKVSVLMKLRQQGSRRSPGPQHTVAGYGQESVRREAGTWHGGLHRGGGMERVCAYRLEATLAQRQGKMRDISLCALWTK